MIILGIDPGTLITGSAQVPANSIVPLAINDAISGPVGCVAAAVQSRPPLVERNTPAP